MSNKITIEEIATVGGRAGLDLWASLIVVEFANKLDYKRQHIDVELENEKNKVADPYSIMSTSMLAACSGTDIKIRVKGDYEQDARKIAQYFKGLIQLDLRDSDTVDEYVKNIFEKAG